MPVEAIETTLNEYNRCVAGEKPGPFRRTGDTHRLSGDQWVRLGPTRSWFTTTEGSPAVNENMQVLDQNGQPVPGLYAVGQNGLGGQVLWGHGYTSRGPLPAVALSEKPWPSPSETYCPLLHKPIQNNPTRAFAHNPSRRADTSVRSKFWVVGKSPRWKAAKRRSSAVRGGSRGRCSFELGQSALRTASGTVSLVVSTAWASWRVVAGWRGRMITIGRPTRRPCSGFWAGHGALRPRGFRRSAT